MNALDIARALSALAVGSLDARRQWSAFVAKVREMDHPPGGPKTGSIGDITPKLDRSGNRDEN